MYVVYYTQLGETRRFVAYYDDECVKEWYNKYPSTTESLWIIPGTVTPEDTMVFL